MATKKCVLVIYFSFSSQTRNLIRAIVNGLEEAGVEVKTEMLKPIETLQFPLKSYYKTIKMMIVTSLRSRIAIKPIGDQCLEVYDLILLAGPTWSYNPSGPILTFIDRDGKRVMQDRNVMPVISCRGYWRVHLWGLKKLLNRCGATIASPVIFTHTTREPWRTIGVFLKLVGKVPESGKSWFRRYYPKYGHSRMQIKEAERIGQAIGRHLIEEKSMQILSFPKPIPFSRHSVGTQEKRL